MSDLPGYRSGVNPGIANEFSTAGFRLGHSLLGDDVEFLDNDGGASQDEVPCATRSSTRAWSRQTGIDRSSSTWRRTQSQEIDNQVVDSLRNFLFGPPGAGGFDLAR